MNTVALSPHVFCTKVLHIRSFVFQILPTDISECRARGGGRRQNTSLDAAHTQIFLVARRVAQLFHISRFIQCTCIGSRLDESSQHVCRVLRTVRLIHSHSSISCLVASSWACLIVVLPFHDATIPAAVSGLAEWLNSPRSHRGRCESAAFSNENAPKEDSC